MQQQPEQAVVALEFCPRLRAVTQLLTAKFRLQLGVCIHIARARGVPAAQGKAVALNVRDSSCYSFLKSLRRIGAHAREVEVPRPAGFLQEFLEGF